MRLRTEGWSLKGCRVCMHLCDCVTIAGLCHTFYTRLYTCRTARVNFFFWRKTWRSDGHANAFTVRALYGCSVLHLVEATEKKRHCDTCRLWSEYFPSAPCTTLALLKENGRQAWPLLRPNPVNQHSALARSSSQIKNKIHLERRSRVWKMGWKKTPSKLQLLYSKLK